MVNSKKKGLENSKDNIYYRQNENVKKRYKRFVLFFNKTKPEQMELLEKIETYARSQTPDGELLQKGRRLIDWLIRNFPSR